MRAQHEAQPAAAAIHHLSVQGESTQPTNFALVQACPNKFALLLGPNQPHGDMRCPAPVGSQAESLASGGRGLNPGVRGKPRAARRSTMKEVVGGGHRVVRRTRSRRWPRDSRIAEMLGGLAHAYSRPLELETNFGASVQLFVFLNRPQIVGARLARKQTGP